MLNKPVRKPAPKPDDPEEYKRFLETAEAVGASKDPKPLERAVKSIAPARKDARSSGA